MGTVFGNGLCSITSYDEVMLGEGGPLTPPGLCPHERQRHTGQDSAMPRGGDSLGATERVDAQHAKPEDARRVCPHPCQTSAPQNCEHTFLLC